MTNLNLDTLGDYKMKPNDITTPSVSEDELDFRKIVETTKQAQKKLNPKKTIGTLTSSERKAIPLYINDMTSYIKRYAVQGKSKLEYDCSKLSAVCFEELAAQFKQKNPLFFVLQDRYTQLIVVEWTGKNEV